MTFPAMAKNAGPAKERNDRTTAAPGTTAFRRAPRFPTEEAKSGASRSRIATSRYPAESHCARAVARATPRIGSCSLCARASATITLTDADSTMALRGVRESLNPNEADCSTITSMPAGVPNARSDAYFCAPSSISPPDTPVNEARKTGEKMWIAAARTTPQNSPRLNEFANNVALPLESSSASQFAIMLVVAMPRNMKRYAEESHAIVPGVMAASRLGFPNAPTIDVSISDRIGPVIRMPTAGNANAISAASPGAAATIGTLNVGSTLSATAPIPSAESALAQRSGGSLCARDGSAHDSPPAPVPRRCRAPDRWMVGEIPCSFKDEAQGAKAGGANACVCCSRITARTNMSILCIAGILSGDAPPRG
mmetsp:Transcript_14630/g.33991  ORF Transcript_14630/g.33991 Transcript_14630/m.33991 type:complete len:368 (+) Transcript_14630:265-1368(+)